MAFEIIDVNTIFGPWPNVHAEMSVERLTAALAKHGVSKAMAISTIGTLHNHNDGNAETIRICNENEALIPVATIDPRGYFGPPSIVATLAEQGFRMFRFFSLVQGWPLDLASFGDLLDALSSVKLPVMVQARETGCPSAMAGNLIGRDNTFILEGVSFENMAEAVSVMRKYENVMVETHELRVPGALRFLVDQIGADRVLFGSGYLRNSLAAAIGYIMETEISDDDKAKILGGNMKRLIGG